MKTILYHGSANIIEQPVYHGGRRYNDYGYGFYCTEDEHLAGEWAVAPDHDGYVNRYEIDLTSMKICDLNRHGTLCWLAVLLRYRTFNVTSPLAAEAKDYLLRHFSVDLRRADIVTGYRADDSYFSFAQDFINGTISFRQLGEAMRLGRLGEQIVLKSRRAHEAVRFLDAQPVLRTAYLAGKEARDRGARRAYHQSTRMHRQKGDLFMTQIMDEEIRQGDARIQ